MTEISEQYFENQGDQDQATVSSIKKQRTIASIRYKVYIFFMVVILVFMRPVFTSTVDKVRGEGSLDGAFSLSALGTFRESVLLKRGEGGLLNQIDTLEDQLENGQADIDKAMNELEIIDRLNNEGKRNTIITCLNTDECDGVPQDLLPFLGFFRTYMLIDSLEAQKMRFNQKMILKNLNDFILRTVSGQENGRLSSVTFGAPVSVSSQYSLFSIPITIRVSFENSEFLTSFLHNIQERVNLTIPILYKIDSMNYNIVDYPIEQEITISMKAYYIAGLEEDKPQPVNQEISDFDEISLSGLDSIGSGE